MKTSVILFVFACGIVAGGIVYFNHHKAAPPQPPPIADAAPTAPPTDKTETTSEPPPNSAILVAPKLGEGGRTAAPAPAPTDAKSAERPNPITKTVDALLAAKKDKQALL